MKFETILLQKADGIATITLNRPDELNILTIKMTEELLQALTDIADDKSVRVAILTGAGRHFSAGIKLQERFMEPIEKNRRGEYGPALAYLFGTKGVPALMNLGKPIIAAVNGAAIGLGSTLCMACDMRIASEKAKFSFAFVKMGVSAEFGSTWILPRLIGIGKSLELLYTGKIVEAAEAKEIGLVNQVVPPDKLLGAASEMARTIASMPPISIKLIREGVFQGAQTDLQSALKSESTAFRLCLSTDDHEEGVRAFLEKRTPNFKGK
ncbi:MAG: enoyl-CoA hydratase [Dehalococcoidales bacterium]|nr:enoyl-CoA hydratase [Dehalococcoidales bacterium]